MLNTAPRFLFISHDAARTGAPLLLLHFLRWLKHNKPNVSFDILLLKDGALKGDFEALARTYTIPDNYKFTLTNKVRARINPQFIKQYQISEVVNKLSKNCYELVYGNTVVSLPWLLEFKKRKSKVVCAIHELTNAIMFYFLREYVLAELPNIDLIIAGSEAVKINLTENFGIPHHQISVFHAFIDRHSSIFRSAKSLRYKLGVNSDELLIGGMSQIELRKGVDLVVPLAVELLNNYPKVKFKIVWVGGDSSENFRQIIKEDAIKCGVDKLVLFVDKTSNPDEYINLYDIFLLLSREDPFPLVMLSAANMAKGIIAFDKSGGAVELLSNGAGFIIPYLNIQEMAKVINELFEDPIKIKKAGNIAQKKIESLFDTHYIAPLIYNALLTLYQQKKFN